MTPMSMSLSNDVPVAIQKFVDTTNAADSDAFVDAFTEDAFLSDWGREYRGHEGVRSWDGTDNIGKRARFELLAVKPGKADQQFIATVVVTGDGYNGTSDLEFTLRGDKVSRLVIAP